jgi:LysM repeat protein
LAWIRLAACLGGVLSPGITAHADPSVWRVQTGDVLSTIAQRFGLTVDELRRWNGLEGDRILVGQELLLHAPEPSASSSAPEQAAPEQAATPAEPERPAPSQPAPPPAGSTITLERGQTLSGVAQRLGVPMQSILAMNPGLDPDRVRAGARIAVPERRRRVEHEVRRGEILGRLAQRYEVSVREILRWNPSLRRRSLRAGETLIVFTDVPESRSESVGATNHGQLLHGEALPPNPGYVIRDGRRAFGTVETVRWIVEAFDALRDVYPDAPRLRVHDISDEDGGHLVHHRSHQSGRDADISYFYRRCGEVCRMGRINPSLLDVERQWALVEHWLRAGVIEAIFMDYALQAPLYERARELGATPQELHRWFQYPRGPSYPLGLIRHFPKHDDHFHVRFVCPETDAECRGR